MVIMWPKAQAKYRVLLHFKQDFLKHILNLYRHAREMKNYLTAWSASFTSVDSDLFKITSPAPLSPVSAAII
jgi:hypothetical protein